MGVCNAEQQFIFVNAGFLGSAFILLSDSSLAWIFYLFINISTTETIEKQELREEESRYDYMHSRTLVILKTYLVCFTVALRLRYLCDDRVTSITLRLLIMSLYNVSFKEETFIIRTIGYTKVLCRGVR